MMMATVRSIPVLADAVQFKGWQTAYEIFRWTRSCFFVGRGAEHGMRIDSEADRSNAHILEDAPEFLVFVLNDELVRVDLDSWIIRDRDGKWSVFTHYEMQRQWEIT